MKRSLTTLIAFGLMLLAAPAAQASFGVTDFDVTFNDQDGTPVTVAGSHPYSMTTTIHFREKPDPTGQIPSVPDEQVKDLIVKLPPGFAGNPGATPLCATSDFNKIDRETETPGCPDATVIGTVRGEISNPGLGDPRAVFNLVPPPGVINKFGFLVTSTPVTVEVTLNPEPPYNVIARANNLSQGAPVFGSELTLWGNPAHPSHDSERGACIIKKDASCPVGIPEIPFLTMPTSCRGPLVSIFEADSWQNPGAKLGNGEADLSDPAWVTGLSETHYATEPPEPLPMSGCSSLLFKPTISAKPTTIAANSPTGLDFSLDVNDEGINNVDGRANSYFEKAVVTLPEGFTANPSLAEGLNVCTEAQLAKDTAFSAPGAGCPQASKIGAVEVESPVLDKTLGGSLYIAKPYDNPAGSLLALYIVVQDPELGIVVKQTAKVEPDPRTGQLTTVTEDIPELPISKFKLRFREGTRSPLASPPGCGSYAAEATLTPYSGTGPVTTSSVFQISVGPEGGPCPSGVPALHPDLMAGTVSNAAGQFSPFNVRITRKDSEQEITHFSIKLPPGVAGKLAGIPYCSDAAIAQAISRTGPHGGQEELDSPSCPAASQVGRTLAGAGVGPSLAYAPGKIYLAGPYHGAPISFVSITSGVVGPFDIGTVVVRLAIRVNPETGEVFLDSTGSDPIPHIVKGIPVHLRDIRAYTDRPDFTFNPTSCAPTSTSATLLGSGADFVSTADDNPFVSTSRFQAADCAALPFGPKLNFKLKGSTKRGGNPSLQAHLGMKGFGEAAIRFAQVTLPKSEFLEQAHIGTVCTRVQFKEGSIPGEKCPTASIYGKVIARSPILAAPLAGPIFLRSNPEHELPDLVAALHGQIDIALAGRIDSGDNGGIRNTFEFVPDAPVTSADFTFFGGKKSLLANSRNLCASTNKVKVMLRAHSGKKSVYKTPLKPIGCKKKGKAKRRARHG